MSLKSLKGSRTSLKGRMTSLVNFLPHITQTTNVEDLKVRLTSAEQFLNEFYRLEGLIFDKDENEPSEIIEFEEKYFLVVSKLNQWIAKHNLANNFSFSSNSTTSSRSEVKLPKIQIPPFSGNFTEWQSFYDLFHATIHSNTNIRPVEKFQYLKTFLRGEALSLLTHLPISDAGYLEAFSKLCQRYDHKKHIVNSFIKTFTDQPLVKTADAFNIRKLLDTSDEVIRGLRALGSQAESRDPWLIYMLLNKLDIESQRLWSQASSNKDFPTLSDFFKFLIERADSLQSLQSCVRHATTTKSAPIRGMVATSVDQCSLCKADHSLTSCPTFKGMSLEDRRQYVRENNRCFNCLSTTHGVYRCSSRKRCNSCNRRHHSLLHSDQPYVSPTNNAIQSHHIQSTASNEVEPQINDSTNIASQSENHETAESLHISSTITRSILPTAMVHIKNAQGQLINCCALLDSGSQVSFVTESLIQRLNLPRRNGRISISGMGQCSAGVSKGISSLIIQSKVHSEKRFKIEALIVNKVTSTLPATKLKVEKWVHLNKLKLADPTYYEPKQVELLIGADHFFNLLCSEKITGNDHQPIAQNTILGWVISGPINYIDQAQDQASAVTNLLIECDLDRSLRRFWEIEELSSTNAVKTTEEEACEQHFITNTRRLEDNRFCVRLPFKKEAPQLGKSLYMAIQRQKTMERRFQLNLEFATMYKNFMIEYEQLGHMQKLLPSEINEDGYYLPHHGVLKESSCTTKLRVVFDASARTTLATSLNENLLVGPVVQDSLYNILIRFRKHKFVLCGDIEKMYRQIWVDPIDTKYQKIVWRSDTSKPLDHYQLRTVTYGTSSAPFLATRSLKQLSLEVSDPVIAKLIRNDIYVDDVMTGANDLETLSTVKSSLTKIFSASGFNLRKFSSNSPKLLLEESQANHPVTPKIIEESSNEFNKVLGLQWNPNIDSFKFLVNLDPETMCTKRNILSESSKIFDPLGWLAPSIIQIKVFFQNLWLLKLAWDEELPDEHKMRWLAIRSELKKLEKINIPRWLQTTSNEIELHGFCDASQVAYGAAVYCRFKINDKNYATQLITAKTKVAPIKQLSIPRLELCGALLLSRLLQVVEKALDMNILSITAWTDSTIVLDWLSDRPSKWKTFVGNRTSEILETLTRKSWRHIRSKDNPADCASRGISPVDLASSTIWWSGPSWLQCDKDEWPQEIYAKSTTEEEMRTINVRGLVSEIKENELLNDLLIKYSSYFKIIKIIAFVMRFINNTRPTRRASIKVQHLIPEETDEAENILIKYHQQMYLHEDYQTLKKNQLISNHSPLKNMNPFIDKAGILRMGGRLENAKATYDTRHPIILSSKGQIPEMLIRYLHLKYKHSGITLLVNISRQRFWIIRCHDIVKKVIKSCVICTRHRGRTQEQLMADLPASRVEFIRPFLKVGIDYAGPFQILLTRRRGQHPQKTYICIFVCFSTKATHIELVQDMTTDSFLAALKRFVSRRGLCTDIYSDNGSNFVGANNDLREIFNNLAKNNILISDFLLADQIKWHFNPPSAASFGGIYEAAVKSMKFHLRRVIGETLLTMDEMNTLLTEVEAILNSRPICLKSSNEVDALTPGHFLIGRPLIAVPERVLTDVKLGYNQRWKLLYQITQHFWRRWSLEYLTSLQMRNKWLKVQPNLNQGDIVLIKNENLPPAKWLMGKVEELFPGVDKRVRVVNVKTTEGTYRRPVNKLVLLPVESTDSSPAECSSSGYLKT